MEEKKISPEQCGAARAFASQGGAVDIAGRAIVDLIVSRVDSHVYPDVQVFKGDDGLPVIRTHHRTITSRLSHVFLQRDGIQRDVGGRLVFYLEPTEDGELPAMLCTLTFSQQGLVSMGKFPNIDFSTDETPPHVGFASKLVIDTLLHRVQERFPVVKV